MSPRLPQACSEAFELEIKKPGGGGRGGEHIR